MPAVRPTTIAPAVLTAAPIVPIVPGSESTASSVAISLVGSDLFPVDLFHLRRALVGGTLARAWFSFVRGGTTHVVSFRHGGSSADPTVFVPALAGATHTLVDLGSSSRSANFVAAAVVTALSGAGITGATADGAIVAISNASSLMIPPAVDMTDTSLRGMWGMQRDDWGDGGAGQTLNQNGGTGGTGNVHLGQVGTAGRILGVYLWTRTDTVPTVVRLGASMGPAYSTSPTAMTLLDRDTATIQGFGGVVFEAVAFGGSDHLWAHYRSDTATAGIRYRQHAASPVGRGQLGAGEQLLWDTTASASAATDFGSSYTPTVNATFGIYVAIGVVFELPDADGHYPADGSLRARIGDQSNDPDHGTQYDVAPNIIDGETTHHRQVLLPWTAAGVTSVTRTIGDTTSGEDSRAVIYAWDDLDFPSTTPAELVADLGLMGFIAGAGNRAVTHTLPARVEVGTDVIAGAIYWSLGFNYVTATGDPLTTMVLPVFLDDVPGDSGWLDAWTDDRETWHDDIRGANNYAQPAGVTEYRTRVSAGNTGMPTESTTDLWPDPMATDASDDSPSAIALDWLIVERAGFTAL